MRTIIQADYIDGKLQVLAPGIIDVLGYEPVEYRLYGSSKDPVGYKCHRKGDHKGDDE
ncbi:hypothetical protein [Syntrophothermus lipocalidus]|uniref:hypothetical protein n=1 Tax=Syntrophothermus lipocalidus TaxID=86170 RepID=UPI00145F12F0|nr:hypothetical protein [Syntrophothermus lipocalidus]